MPVVNPPAEFAERQIARMNCTACHPRDGQQSTWQKVEEEMTALQSAKAELYTAFLASGIRKAELARRLRIPKTTVDRLFDFENQTRLDQIEAAFAALGKELSIIVRDAA